MHVFCPKLRTLKLHIRWITATS